ncbi:hypothetical protein GCM10009717_01210 [Agromyces allii]|uniref:Uncharacterized protein n=1 Tax=Agromyces allii TaxID=393607 RepID=A0ABP5BC40_9MICO
METSRPVCASETPSPADICGSTAVGSISAVTMTKVAAPSTISAGQGRADVGARPVPERVDAVVAVVAVVVPEVLRAVVASSMLRR